jgi:hypothetical protein
MRDGIGEVQGRSKFGVPIKSSEDKKALPVSRAFDLKSQYTKRRNYSMAEAELPTLCTKLSNTDD